MMINQKKKIYRISPSETLTTSHTSENDVYSERLRFFDVARPYLDYLWCDAVLFDTVQITSSYKSGR